jgi:DNA polymerase
MSELHALVQQVQACTLCSLSQKRTQAVPGEGSTTADIVFIGEAPGFYEDRDGRPFVGPAGKFLNELLASIGLRREDVYITNMVKCRPPNNRDPLPGEVQACRPYLDRQLAIIGPRVIATLGRHSFSKFFPSETISKARGKPRKWGGRVVYPMYHPAAALHNPALRPVIERDFKRLPSLLDELAQMHEEADQGNDKQLSLFEDH